MSAFGRTLSAMLDELGAISDDPDCLTRTFLSPAMRQANMLVGRWMTESGLSVREDAVGNLIGRLESPAATRRTLILGSHLDTVRNAGRFDGALGVLAPLLALRALESEPLPFAVEVVGFSEEEGVRFSSAYIGSKAYCGQLRAGDLAVSDPSGASLREVLRRHNGGRFSPPRPVHRAKDLLGYCEVHIEQGPVLETEDLALGVVTSIAGQTRGQLTWIGEAAHAGTTPMHARRDALAAAAEFVVYVEQFAAAHPPLVATVGTINVSSGAPNVVPGEVVLSLDVRHPRDASRANALARLLEKAGAIGRRRKIRVEWSETQSNPAIDCSGPLRRVLEQSVNAVQGRCPRLVSGAGHDGVVVSSLAPVAMLFVRCRRGLSHHPDEYASPADLDAAVRALVEFLRRLAVLHRPDSHRQGGRR